MSPTTHQPTVRNLIRRLVLPDSDTQPVDGLQQSISFSVPLYIAVELLDPPIAVVRGNHSVIGAGAPEASVQEDCYLPNDKGNITTTTQAARNWPFDTITLAPTT